jgi:hypothetical protein
MTCEYCFKAKSLLKTVQPLQGWHLANIIIHGFAPMAIRVKALQAFRIN